MKNTVIVGLVVMVAAAAGYIVQQNYYVSYEAQQNVQQSAADGRVAFTLPDLQGVERQLSEWDGEARLVNFWATWCAPCRREIPLLKQLQHDKFEQRLQVIGVAVDHMEDVVAYAEEARFNYPVLVGQEKAMAAAESSGVEFIGLPFTMVITSDSTLVVTHMGEIKQEHVERIASVMRDFESGALDLGGARQALSAL